MKKTEEIILNGFNNAIGNIENLVCDRHRYLTEIAHLEREIERYRRMYDEANSAIEELNKQALEYHKAALEIGLTNTYDPYPFVNKKEEEPDESLPF